MKKVYLLILVSIFSYQAAAYSNAVFPASLACHVYQSCDSSDYSDVDANLVDGLPSLHAQVNDHYTKDKEEICADYEDVIEAPEFKDFLLNTDFESLFGEASCLDRI